MAISDWYDRDRDDERRSRRELHERDYERDFRGDYGGGAYYDADYDWDYNRYYGRGTNRYGSRYAEPGADRSDYGRSYASTLYAPEGPHIGRGPAGYRRSDERILEDAHERLTRHGYLDARDIRVLAEGGEVTLEGTVDSRRAKRRAEDAVEGVSGVRDVHNHLRIRREARG